ncbi:unnamed protein product [Paramecium sonneborni]|uniref:TLC domain-containing protein n=1 Tax=Paramecium sonneborni TaxID=65129 RepID=A0A8S1P6H3_9CILI|nr:unnamed protein product [Paramecium sonneborni]
MLNLENIDLVNSTSDQVKVLSYSFFIWTSIFAIVNQKVHQKNQPKKVQDDVKNRIVSIIHGCLTFWAAAYIVLVEQPSFGAPNSQTMQFTMIISASYFIYDFLACLYYDLADMSLVSHHSLAICGYAVATISKFGAPSSIWGLMSAEVSNFPMHMRVIFRQIGLRHTKLYQVCEWTYFALYIIFRGSLVPYMVWNTWPESDVPLLVKITATGLFLQSVYFIFEMKKILTRQYFQYQERKKKNIHHFWFSVNPRVQELSYINNQKKDKVF